METVNPELVGIGAVSLALIGLIGKVWLDSNRWVDSFIKAFEKNIEVNSKVAKAIDKVTHQTSENTKILKEHRKFMENLNGKLEKAIQDRIK